jgi:branched-chain amino acid aminotransferase
MPEFDIEVALNALKELIAVDEDWIPTLPGTSLYIRPTMISTEAVLGVHPANSYRFFIILSPVGSYYANGLAPTKIKVEEVYVRAPLGGTGEAKCMGNYAASLLAGGVANKEGYDQVLWLDAKDRKYAEEVGSMNIFFVLNGVVKTPALLGSILPGITRDSVVKLLKKLNIPCEETHISVDEIVAGVKDGTLTEVFGSGTAAVISPVGTLGYKGTNYTVNGNKMGEITTLLYNTLTSIQGRTAPDPFKWITVL